MWERKKNQASFNWQWIRRSYSCIRRRLLFPRTTYLLDTLPSGIGLLRAWEVVRDDAVPSSDMPIDLKGGTR